MKTFLKILLGTIIATSIIIGGLELLIYKSTASTLQGFQGGTGIATSTSANDNKCLIQSSSTPFLNWSISNCGTGTLSGNGTSSQVAYYTGSTTLSSSLNLVFNSLSGLLTVLGQVSSTNILAVHTTTTDLVISSLTGILKSTNGLVSQAISGVDYQNVITFPIPVASTSLSSSSPLNLTGNNLTLTTSTGSGLGNNGGLQLQMGGNATQNCGSGHFSSMTATGTMICTADSGGSITNYWMSSSTTATSTGGTITSDGTYIIHTFTSSGTLTISQNVIADVLIVAGGGHGGTGGGASNGGGGGGGGGGLIHTSSTLYAGSYSVVVGLGATTTNGQNSSFNNKIAIGGGKGGDYNGGNGNDGGSSGGGAGAFPGGAGNPGIPTSGQGKQGGTGNSSAAEPGGGGGGGFSTSGVTSTDARAGNGGDPIILTISGSPKLYSCGGPGSTWDITGTNGTSTLGCGSYASTTSAGGDATSTAPGSGGGGGNNLGGGKGSDGIVIIRYLQTQVALTTSSTVLTIGIGTSTPVFVPLQVVSSISTSTITIGSKEMNSIGMICFFNGTNYSSLNFTSNSTTPIYATSTFSDCH